jgi:hypothetical protein
VYVYWQILGGDEKQIRELPFINSWEGRAEHAKLAKWIVLLVNELKNFPVFNRADEGLRFP